MRAQITFLLVILSAVQINIYAQQVKRKGSHTLKVCFGGFSGGIISKYDHLGDSLAFTDSVTNEMLHIASFKMAFACNGNVINYLENKSGNKLTAEMKEAIREMHPGCTISFQGIKALFKSKDIHGKFSELDPGILKLTLKD